jgi:hypothetical protein
LHVSFVGDLRKNLDIDERIDSTVAAFVVLSVATYASSCLITVSLLLLTVDELISPLFKEVLGQELLSALEEAVVGFVETWSERLSRISDLVDFDPSKRRSADLVLQCCLVVFT